MKYLNTGEPIKYMAMALPHYDVYEDMLRKILITKLVQIVSTVYCRT